MGTKFSFALIVVCVCITTLFGVLLLSCSFRAEDDQQDIQFSEMSPLAAMSHLRQRGIYASAIFPESSGLCRYSDGHNGKYGYVNTSAELVIPPEYNLAWCFQGPYALVQHEMHMGVIDTQGDMVFGPKIVRMIEILDNETLKVTHTDLREEFVLIRSE